jgi:hypothetical protein
MAGPSGALAGALIGGLVGAAAGVALEFQQAEAEQRDAALDRDIGVVGGQIGEALPDLPPAIIGAFSAAAIGAGNAVGEDSEGPIQNRGESS